MLTLDLGVYTVLDEKFLFLAVLTSYNGYCGWDLEWMHVSK